MNTFLTLDTECIGIDNRKIYDFAYAIHNKTGDVVWEFNYLVEEVITSGKLMGGAFYHEKVYSHYIPKIASGDIALMPWQDIIEQFRHDLKEYNVKAICAYNLAFDIGAIQQTHAAHGDNMRITGGDYKMLCIWQFVCESILSRKKYNDIASELGWFKTSTGNVFTNAEKAYAYITGDYGFVEKHTALEDVRIEVEILTACFKQKRKIPYDQINGKPWMLAQ